MAEAHWDPCRLGQGRALRRNQGTGERTSRFKGFPSGLLSIVNPFSLSSSNGQRRPVVHQGLIISIALSSIFLGLPNHTYFDIFIQYLHLPNCSKQCRTAMATPRGKVELHPPVVPQLPAWADRPLLPLLRPASQTTPEPTSRSASTPTAAPR